MDIKIRTDKENFKYRVCGILTHNGKYLGVKIADNKFYCLPGGHIEIGEDTEIAALREMGEELGYPVKVKRLAGIAENFFKGKNDLMFHELGFYYEVEAENPDDVNAEDYERVEIDKGEPKKLVFKWFTKEKIAQSDFRPPFIKDMINSNGMLHVICKSDKVEKEDEYTL